MRKILKIKKTINNLAHLASVTIDKDLGWMFVFDRYFEEAKKINGNKSVFDKRTRGGKYFEQMRRLFYQGLK